MKLIYLICNSQYVRGSIAPDLRSQIATQYPSLLYCGGDNMLVWPVVAVAVASALMK